MHFTLFQVCLKSTAMWPRMNTETGFTSSFRFCESTAESNKVFQRKSLFSIKCPFFLNFPIQLKYRKRKFCSKKTLECIFTQNEDFVPHHLYWKHDRIEYEQKEGLTKPVPMSTWALDYCFEAWKTCLELAMGRERVHIFCTMWGAAENPPKPKCINASSKRDLL